MADPILANEIFQAAKSALDKTQFRRLQKSRLDAILRIYVVVGLTIAIISLGFFGFTFLEITLTEEQSFALLAAGTGFALAAFSAALINIRKQNLIISEVRYRDQNQRGKLVDSWARFESLAKKILDYHGGDFNRHSPRILMEQLKVQSVIGEDEFQRLRSSLELRNKLVHTFDNVPNFALQSALESMDEIILKLEDVLQKEGLQVGYGETII